MNTRTACGSASKLLSTALCLGAIAPPSAQSQAPVEYPLVFGAVEEMQGLGITLGRTLPNECYAYGEAGYGLSFTNAFLDRYRAHGFTLHSLCMALVSGIRFDPETGARLPTYIVVDFEALDDPERREDVGVVSDELPFAAPLCFRRGLPLSDCRFDFDPRTGRRLSAAETKRIERDGVAVEKWFEDALRAGRFSRECTCDEHDESCRHETFGECGDYESGALVPEQLWLEGFDDVGFYDVSPSLPTGYGYALYAEGGAGPATDTAAVAAARDGKKRATGVRIKAVKVLLETKYPLPKR